MRHLTADELVDLVEGVALESDVPHLATCATCRQQLAELHATMAMASDAEVPAPSPLFWDHFSSRVRDAVAAERAVRGSWWRRLSSWPGVMAPMSAAAAAILVFAIVLKTMSTPSNRPEVTSPAPVASSAQATTSSALPGTSGVELLNDSMSADDPSLTLVADLTDALGWNEAADADLALAGSAEHAVTHLSRDELSELERLLKEALGGKGA
ncbi:MAG TPA: hypothetical protein VGQ16_10640 [Vicinamibacterales bacterium]|jgi:anti-sigma-K factor RskA|nr:hypothetical protein [Vicinamibacterales bacterium]